MSQIDLKDELKKQAAIAALSYIEQDAIVGVGTGSTVAHFIDALATIKHNIEGAVSSSKDSTEKLKAHGINVFDLNAVGDIAVYVDGADEIDKHFYMIKGGGGAQTREKIIAAAAKKFICIADSAKKVDILGRDFPIAVEVIPMARSFVARQIVKLDGDPVYRQNFVTDNGNIILDVHNLSTTNAIQIEEALNNITGVVEHGLFAKRGADVLLLGTENGVITSTNS